MLKRYLYVFLVSMVPLIELRGAIPIGVGLGLPLWQVYVIAIIGNMLPVRRKAQAESGARAVLGAAAVCRHSGAGYRRVDRHAGCQPAGYGF